MANETPFTLIANLSTISNSPAIKARVTHKGDVNTYPSAKGGQGKVFSVELLDSSAAIRATAFGENAEKHYGDLEVGKVHEIRNFSVKMSKAGYTSIKNDYELVLTAQTTIRTCLSDDKSVPKYLYNFAKLNQLTREPVGKTIDVIGMCVSVSSVESINTKRGEFKKREVAIVDQSHKQVMVTFWGLDAEQFSTAYKHHVVAIQNVRISDFNGVSLNSSKGCTFKVDPQIPEAKLLQDWYDECGASTTFDDLSCKQRQPTDTDSKISALFRDIENKMQEKAKIEQCIEICIQQLMALWKSKMPVGSEGVASEETGNAEDNTKRQKLQ